jgi:hypothetical protein
MFDIYKSDVTQCPAYKPGQARHDTALLLYTSPAAAQSRSLISFRIAFQAEIVFLTLAPLHPSFYSSFCFIFDPTAPFPHRWARASSFTRFLDHTQRHTTLGRDSSGRVIIPSQRPQPYNSQHSQEMNPQPQEPNRRRPTP